MRTRGIACAHDQHRASMPGTVAGPRPVRAILPRVPASSADAVRTPAVGAIRSRLGAPALPALLVLVVAAVDLAYLAAHGPALGGDTGRYVEGGQALFHGEGLTPRQELHAGYIVFVGLFQLAGLGLSAIAVGQIVVTALATAAVFALA